MEKLRTYICPVPVLSGLILLLNGIIGTPAWLCAAIPLSVAGICVFIAAGKASSPRWWMYVGGFAFTSGVAGTAAQVMGTPLTSCLSAGTGLAIAGLALVISAIIVMGSNGPRKAFVYAGIESVISGAVTAAACAMLRHGNLITITVESALRIEGAVLAGTGLVLWGIFTILTARRDGRG